METNSDYSVILDALKEAGIKETKLDKAITTSFLPEGENLVVGWDVEGESPFTHAVLYTKQGGRVTLSNLTGSAHFGTKDEATFTISTRKGAKSEGMLFLSGQRVNPSLPSDQAKAISALMGKKITAKLQTGFIQKFVGTSENPEHTNDLETAKKRLVPKDFYKIITIK